jgi:non-homologous end joining protein Ku
MVQLASQLVERQSGEYDAADLDDRYETPLRVMTDAKLKGDLMAALKRAWVRWQR